MSPKNMVKSAAGKCEKMACTCGRAERITMGGGSREGAAPAGCASRGYGDVGRDDN